jgi:hypothetical protein
MLCMVFVWVLYCACKHLVGFNQQILQVRQLMVALGRFL